MLKRAIAPLPSVLAAAVTMLAFAPQAQAIKVGVFCASGNASFRQDLVDSLNSTKLLDSVTDQGDLRITTPSAADFEKFDAVVVCSDGSGFASGNEFGNNAVEAIEKNGLGLVIMNPYVTYSFGGIQGSKLDTDYNLVDSGNMARFFGLTLGMTKMHAAMAGVSSIKASGNTCIYESGLGMGSVRHGGDIVAQWSDGSPMVIAGVINGHARVDINMWAASTNIGFSGCRDPSDDGARMIANALVFTASPLRANPGTLDFGSVGVGVETSAQTMEITNTGSNPVTLNSGMATSTEFTVKLNGGASYPITLNAGDKFSFDVTFKPSGEGQRSGGYTAKSGTMGVPDLNVTFSGTGIGPQFTADPASYDFGGVPTGAPNRKVTINISNTGGGQLVLQKFVLTDTMNFMLGAVPPMGKILNAGASNSVDVTFTPTAEMKFTANLQVTFRRGMMGMDETANIPLTGSSGKPKINVPGAISLRAVRVGLNGSTETVTVTNTGFADLTLKTIQFMGANPGDFKVDTMPPMVVPPNGGTLDVKFHFAPTMQGLRKADLHIGSDDPMTPDAVVALDAKGTVAKFDIDVMSLDFTSMPQETGTCSPAQNVTISNAGDDSLTLLSVTLTGPNAASFKQPLMGGRKVPAMGKVVIPVQFCPQVYGSQTANLVISTDLMPGHMATVALSGKAFGGKLVAAPAALDFGPVYIKTMSPAKTITLTNTGDKDLTFGKSVVDPPMPFAVSGLPKEGDTLAAMSKIMVSVTANPTMSIVSNSTLNILVSDKTLPMGMLKIPLTVTGIQGNVTVLPKMMSFGVVGVGAKSVPQTLTVLNTGMAPLNNMNLMVSGASSNDFTFEGTPPASLDVNKKVDFKVYFKPTAAGMRNAILVINAMGLSVPEQVRLDGTGKSFSVACNPEQIDYGMVEVGGMKTQSVICTNMETVALNLDTSFSDNMTDWAVMSDSSTLPPSGALELKVTFSPMAEGARNTTMDIKLKDSGMPISSIFLAGAGLAKTMTMPPPPGGGGCSVSGPRGAGMGALLGLLLLLPGLLYMRRRRA